MNHWISKELQRLERLIDRASEKGWRKEKFEYLDKKQLLRKPSEQQRLLEEVPQVIPETEDNKDTEFQVTGQDKPIQKSTVALQGTDGERDLSLESLSEEKPEVNKAHTDGGTAVIHNQNRSTTAAIAALPKYLHRHAATEANNAGDISSVQELDGEGVKASTDVDTTGTDVQHGSIEATKANAAGDAPGAFFQKQCAKAADVITIDDDDEDNSHRCYKEEQTAVVDLEADYAGDNHPVQLEANSRGHKHVKVKERIWYYIDPQGDEQGPFTMQHLSIWWSNGFFPGDFRVWRTGQTSNDAILLVDVLQMTR